jgi:adenosylhomocysteinase
MNMKYKVKDIGLAEFGRKEIELAEREMPALMKIRLKYRKDRPLEGARIVGCIHMTIQTAVLIETLVDLGAEVKWSSCNIYSTQDHAAAAIADRGIPVFAWKGETEEEYEWCIRQTIEGWEPNMILDDGGDATKLIHDEYPELLKNIHGVSEETTTGVHRLKEMLKKGELKIPAINVNDSVTKAKNDNKYGCRHSLSDALKRSTDMLLMGKQALVMGYGDVGKGSAQSLKQEGMIVRVSEIDPICAMQACMDGFEVVLPEEVVDKTDVLVTATGNFNVCHRELLDNLKDGAVVCNIGHFDNEIDVAYLEENPNYVWEEVKENVHKITRRGTGEYLILLARGRLVNLGNATGHPSRIMDGSFANQVLAQIELYRSQPSEVSVRVLPKHLDEEVARYMVEGFGGKIVEMTKSQSEYIGLPVTGPFKDEEYKY